MSKDYEEYLQSEHWKRLAEETKRLAGYRCQVCNSAENLCAHHRTYERRGDELQSDLTCLCLDCHAVFHKKDKPRKKRLSEFDAILIEVAREKTAKSGGDFYKGIQIVWDEDRDARIYEAIDFVLQHAKLSEKPLYAGEHEGILTLSWRNYHSKNMFTGAWITAVETIQGDKGYIIDDDGFSTGTESFSDFWTIVSEVCG